MSKKILIVDDEPDIIDILKVRLSSHGFDVFVATDGKSCLAAMRSEKPDLLVLDVMMPEVNGFQVCRQLKDDDEYKHIPIILLTAKAEESDKFWGEEAGADAYITKPYEPQELLQSINELLAK